MRLVVTERDAERERGWNKVLGIIKEEGTGWCEVLAGKMRECSEVEPSRWKQNSQWSEVSQVPQS